MTQIIVEYVPNITGTPSQRIAVSPQPVAVQGGQEVVLTWIPKNCTFPDADAIVFQPDTLDPTPWPYPQPTKQSDGSYQVSYMVNTPEQTTYNYNVSVISGGGTTYFRADPDVTNTPQ